MNSRVVLVLAACLVIFIVGVLLATGNVPSVSIKEVGRSRTENSVQTYYQEHNEFGEGQVVPASMKALTVTITNISTSFSGTRSAAASTGTSVRTPPMPSVSIKEVGRSRTENSVQTYDHQHNDLGEGYLKLSSIEAAATQS